MPMYYDIAYSTTGSAANTASTADHIRLVSGTTLSAAIKGLYGAARSCTAGGGQLILWQGSATTSAGGSAYTIQKRNQGYASALTCALTGLGCASAQATANKRVTVGFAQTGGMGGWVAIEPDAAVMLTPGGGAGGSGQVGSVINSASIPFDISLEFSEQ